MGIVIGYRGTLDDLTRVDGLIEDVRLFCKKVSWEFTEISDPISGVALATAADFMGRPKKKAPVEEWPEDETLDMGSLKLRFNAKNATLLEETWRGIVAHPPGTESLALTFDGKGRLCHYMDIPQHWVKGPLRDQKHYVCFPLFCKTTGEIEQHVAICVLLKMLGRRYMKNLKVSDSTGYFKSGSLTKLREGHALMGMFTRAIKESPTFLKTVFKAAGLSEELAETAVPVTGALKRPAALKAPLKAKRATVH